MSVDGSANRVNYGTCSTAAATAAKTVSCTGFALITGAEITVKFTVTNTASSPTLNVNGTGAKAIYYRGSAITAGYLAANRTYTFRYNGTQYELVGDINTDGSVTQGRTTVSSYRPLLLHNLYGNYGTDVGGTTAGTYYHEAISANPSTGTIRATSFTGSGNVTIGTTGMCTVMNNQGAYIQTTSSGGWARAFGMRHSTDGETWTYNPLVGMLGSGDTLKYIYFGGTDHNTFWAKLEPDGKFTATSFAGSGASLTSLNAGNISSGTLAVARGGTGATTAAAALTNLGITATAAELNKLDGVTATTAELNYVDGVTSNIQTQLNDKLPLSGGTAIPSNADLNTYTTPGVYISGSGTVSDTLTNAPMTGMGFKLIVLDGYISGRVIQFAAGNSNYWYHRCYTGSSWADWAKIYDSSGTVALANGGTATNLSDIPAYAIVRGNSTSGKGLYYTATANGAFYATSANGQPKFGTLPIAQGGTGATTAAAALTALGAAASSHTHSYLPLSGGTLTGTLKIGNPADDATAPGVGIRVHDLRDITPTAGMFGDNQVGFYFDMVGSNWYSIMHMKGWTGSYAAWEIAGNAHTT